MQWVDPMLFRYIGLVRQYLSTYAKEGFAYVIAWCQQPSLWECRQQIDINRGN